MKESVGNTGSKEMISNLSDYAHYQTSQR